MVITTTSTRVSAPLTDAQMAGAAVKGQGAQMWCGAIPTCRYRYWACWADLMNQQQHRHRANHDHYHHHHHHHLIVDQAKSLVMQVVDGALKRAGGANVVRCYPYLSLSLLGVLSRLPLISSIATELITITITKVTTTAPYCVLSFTHWWCGRWRMVR
jgi:heme A synthase